MTEVQIDWAALRHEQGGVPWDAIEGAIEAVREKPDRWEEFATAYSDALDDDHARGFMTLYAPVILGEAGARLPADEAGAVRERIVEFLLDELEAGGDRGDEFALGEFQYACWRMGPAFLPQVLNRLGSDTANGTNWELWQLLALARHCSDAALRGEAARRCAVQVENALGEEDWAGEALEFLHVLGTMRCAEACDVLERLGSQRQPEMKAAFLWERFQKELAGARGEAATELEPEPWEREPREFLEQEHDEWLGWYKRRGGGEEESGGEEFSDDGSECKIHERSGEWADRFAASSQAAALAENMRGEAADRAYMMLKYGMEYLGTDVKNWGVIGWREILLELLPRKVSADADWYEALAPAAGALLRWMEAEGHAACGASLAAEVETWGSQIEEAGNDPGHWGTAKSFVMMARKAGVDPQDRNQMNAFTALYNAKLMALSAPRNEQALGASAAPEGTWPGPFVREAPKVGRNEPCPCGSGKKYKKCCGK